METIELIAIWVYTGLFLYTFPSFVLFSFILMKIFRSIVVFLDEEDMLYSLLAAIPCGFFSFELFYTKVYMLSFSRYIALKFELYRFFDISLLTSWENFYYLSLVFLVLSFIYNLVYAIKYNGEICLKIISAICRTQISILFMISLMSFIGLVHYYWDGAKRLEILWMSYWAVCFLITSLVARAGVKMKRARG